MRRGYVEWEGGYVEGEGGHVEGELGHVEGEGLKYSITCWLKYIITLLIKVYYYPAG